MADIVLATLNARFIHASLGLRCLLANLGELRPRAVLVEFTTAERPVDVVERLLAEEPRIVGLGVYVWNVAATTEVVALLKRIRPAVTVVLGGPEVSHEPGGQEIVRLADHTICGEGEVAFAALCRALLGGGPAPQRLASAAPPDLDALELPYAEYTGADLAHRLVYVEASRGCPFECEFCLSSLDAEVRVFPVDRFLGALDVLLGRGVRHFKFIDRTFNLNLAQARRLLEFFLARPEPGLFLHFEMVPDRFPDELLELVARFPAGSLQFEVGVQTFNPAVAEAIHRRQDYGRLCDNLRHLRQRTGVHLHADLIAGLPGEDAAGFGAGFDRLLALGPQEIQVGILKRLRGAPIARHDAAEAMVYSPYPPYEVLCTRVLDFATVQRLRRFARHWDLVGNSGRFVTTLPLFWEGGPSAGAVRVAEELGLVRTGEGASPFAEFLHFSGWLHRSEGRQHGIALERLAGLVRDFLVVERCRPAGEVGAANERDARRGRPGTPGGPGEGRVLRRAGRQERHREE